MGSWLFGKGSLTIKNTPKVGAESIVGIYLDGSKAIEWSRKPTCSTLSCPVEDTTQASGLGACSLLPLIAADILRALSKCLLSDFVSIYILDAISPTPLTTPNLAPGLICSLLLSTFDVLAQAPTPE